MSVSLVLYTLPLCLRTSKLAIRQRSLRAILSAYIYLHSPSAPRGPRAEHTYSVQMYAFLVYLRFDCAHFSRASSPLRVCTVLLHCLCFRFYVASPEHYFFRDADHRKYLINRGGTYGDQFHWHLLHQSQVTARQIVSIDW